MPVPVTPSGVGTAPPSAQTKTDRTAPRLTAVSAKRLGVRRLVVRYRTSEQAKVTLVVLRRSTSKRTRGRFLRVGAPKNRNQAAGGHIVKLTTGPGVFRVELRAKDTAGNTSVRTIRRVSVRH